MCTNLINLIAKSSIHLIVFDRATNEPIQFGSGCLARYRDRLLVLSVNHVTRITGIDTYTLIETGLPPVDGMSPFYSTGGLIYYDTFRVNGIETGEVRQMTISEDEPLDITFTSIPEDIEIIQKPFEFFGIPITEENKVILNLDYAIDPIEGDYYGLFGHINNEVRNGMLIHSEVTFKLDLKYQGTFNRFHLFQTPEPIRSEKEYCGTSGAPILDSEGRLVGLNCSVNVGTTSLFAFPISYCKQLIDISIDNGLL